MHRIFFGMVFLASLVGLVGCDSPAGMPINAPTKVPINTPTKLVESQVLVDQEVEASCGECQFKMEGAGCDLAIRVDGNSYFVDGSSIDDHGDAHAEDGMCNCVRKARVSGTIENGRFTATKFEVLAK